jgi:asparagine synthase (glutamine-hydrolysing)
MCGIVGVFDSGGRLPERELFASCVERLRRRGPDDGAVWSDPEILLGHRRLAVIDLSSAGSQPMLTQDGRFVIVFNGEIYNHAELRLELTPADGWRGTSDTETLLEAYRAWGIDCLPRMNGMFAFAIWDRVRKCLFAARDRMGVKPLYYGQVGRTFVFGSRPTALVPLLGAGGSEPDAEALRQYLELGYIPSPLSFYRNIRKLRPAHYLLADERGVRVARYWDYRHIPVDRSLLDRPEDALIDELDSLVCESVRSRLMSDVPLGAFLSGGVDSATVVAAMKTLGVQQPRTFTIAFEEAAYNEGPEAAQIAGHLGVSHVTETLSVSNLLDLLPEYVGEFDEPFADSSAFPTMAVARLARQHVTVALTGDAGDELFGGYHYYTLVQRLAAVARWPAPARRLLRSMIGRIPAHRAKLLAGALDHAGDASVFNYLRSFSKDFATLLTPDVTQRTHSSKDWFEQAAASFALDLDSAEVGMRLDMGFMLPDAYLQKVDVATMAFSVEARCPLIDYRLVEWSMRLPLKYKIRGGHTKYLLKKALCRHLPAQWVYRRKRGFGVPVAQWLRGPLRSWAADLLHDDSVMSRLPLQRQQVLQLFDLHQSGARNAQPLLWAVLMLLCYVARHDRGMNLPHLDVRKAA